MENKELLNPNEIKINIELGTENTGNDNFDAELTQEESASENVPIAKKRKAPASKSVETTSLPEVSLDQVSTMPSNGLNDNENLLENQPSEIHTTKDQSQFTDLEMTAKSDLLIIEGDYHDDESQDKTLTDKYSAYTREQLLDALETLVQNDDFAYIRKHIGYLKLAFRNHIKAESVSDYDKGLVVADGPDGDSKTEKIDPIAAKFEEAFSVYKQKKLIFEQAQERQKQANLIAKEEILSELRNLIESEEELKKTYDSFKELQEKWRTIGSVPQSAKNTLWNNYHFLVEKFFDKVKINKELRDLDLRRNLESKTELCEKAEELLLAPLNQSFLQLQKLHEAWKEIGPAPKDKKDDIWDRFKAATDALNERRQSYFDELREEQNKNFAAKKVLCEKAEQYTEFTTESPREWQKATDEINELFNIWKTVGFAPKKVNNEIWNRFRTALDTFFKNKKNFFLKYKDEQSENYNQKLNLCLQAEALKDSEDWKHTTEELIALQQQWKKIGAVPNKFSDKIWRRFRAACDTFFSRKAQFFSSIGDEQVENLKKKRDLIERIKNYPYTQNNNENLNVLQEFQREGMEIGHVPIKLKDQLQEEFRKAINDQFEKLNISKKTKSTIGFKNKIENLRSNPKADSIIYKERSFIVNKINALQNDIKLWENNIGFFASSKKADILKSEFEQRIENARNEISILEEKLKIIRES